MGYAVAEAARDRGAKVTLITAPTALPDPAGVEVVHISSAIEMKKAVTKLKLVQCPDNGGGGG